MVPKSSWVPKALWPTGLQQREHGTRERRRYDVTAKATDNAGNSNTTTTRFIYDVVPRRLPSSPRPFLISRRSRRSRGP